MAITDLWGNSLNGITTDVIGYRGEFTDFPHDLYSYLSSSIREDDQDDVSLIYRWLLGAQSYWESQYNIILGILTLLSPDKCPVEYLEHLKYNVGIGKQFDYVWGTMTENEKRVFIDLYTNMIKFRYSDKGIVYSLEKLTKEFVYLNDFFYYRWIISGDLDSETETAIGRDDDGYDPWLLSDEYYLTGQKPDAISYGSGVYTFTLNELIAVFPYDTIPQYVYVRCLITGVSIKGSISLVAGDYIVYITDEFGQDTTPSTDINQFRISFESDPYISDILITDRDGTLNRDMIEAIVKYNRVASERFYIRYYKWIDKFNNDYFWELDPVSLNTTLTYDEDNRTITMTTGAFPAAGFSFVNVTGSSDWEDYEYTIKLKINTQGTQFFLPFMYIDDVNHYYFRVSQASYAGSYITYTWRLGRLVAGVNTILQSGNSYIPLDTDVYYTWRMNCWKTSPGGVDYQNFAVYHDEALIVEDSETLVWTPTKGSVGVIIRSHLMEVEIDGVSVRPIPVDDTYIGV